MSDSITWFHTSAPVYVVAGDEQVGEHTPNDQPEDGYIAVVFEGAALYGDPLDVIDTLASAIRSVTEHLQASTE